MVFMNNFQIMRVLDCVMTKWSNSPEAFQEVYEATKDLENTVDRVEGFLNSYLEKCNKDSPYAGLHKLSHQFNERDLAESREARDRKQDTPETVLKSVYSTVLQVLTDIDTKQELSKFSKIFLRSMQWCHNLSVCPLHVKSMRIIPSPKTIADQDLNSR